MEMVMNDLSRPVAPKPRVSDPTSSTFELRSLALLRRYQRAHRSHRPSAPPPAPDLRSEWIDPIAYRQSAPLQPGGRCQDLEPHPGRTIPHAQTRARILPGLPPT